MPKSDGPRSTSVAVHNCRFCGSVFPFVDGIERHKEICRFMEQVPKSQTEQLMVTVMFPCPIVAVKRIRVLSASSSGQKSEHIESFHDAVTSQPLQRSSSRRKSSLRALEMLRQEAEGTDDDSDVGQDSEQEFLDVSVSSGEDDDEDSNSDFELEENTKFRRCGKMKIAEKYRTSKPRKNDKDKDREIESVPMIGSDQDFASDDDEENPKPRLKIFSIPKPPALPSNYKYDEKTYYNFRCNHCPARFHEEIRLERHEYNVHGEGSTGMTILTCPICGRMFHGRLLFQSHLKQHEDNEALELSFGLWNKWPRRSSVSKNAFTCQCKYCVVPLKNHDMFVRHMKADHKDKIHQINKYSCTYCSSPEGHNLDSMKHLILHIKSFHQIEYYGRIPKDITVRSKAERYADNPYACPVKGCGSRLKTAPQLKSHFILHLEKNPYACPYPGCKVKLDAACHFRRHMDWHQGKNLIPCEKCGIFFSRRDKMLKHLKLKRCKGTKEIKVRKRKNFLDTNGFLRSHFARTKLSDVGSRSKKKKAAKINIDESAETVNGKSLVIPRKVNINAIIAADPLFIEICKENPDFKNLILRRKRREKSASNETYKCGKCNKSFCSMKNLQQHHSAAHISRPHQCSLCSKSFAMKRFLERHMEFHKSIGNNVFIKQLENGMFQCLQCEAESAHEISIRRHYLLIHKITVPIEKNPEVRKATKSARGRKKSMSTRSSPRKKPSKNISKRKPPSKKKADSVEDVKSVATIKTAAVPVDVSIVKTEPGVTMIVSAEDVKVRAEPYLTENLSGSTQDCVSNSAAAAATTRLSTVESESVVMEHEVGSSICVKREV